MIFLNFTKTWVFSKSCRTTLIFANFFFASINRLSNLGEKTRIVYNLLHRNYGNEILDRITALFRLKREIRWFFKSFIYLFIFFSSPANKVGKARNRKGKYWWLDIRDGTRVDRKISSWKCVYCSISRSLGTEKSRERHRVWYSHHDTLDSIEYLLWLFAVGSEWPCCVFLRFPISQKVFSYAWTSSELAPHAYKKKKASQLLHRFVQFIGSSSSREFRHFSH